MLQNVQCKRPFKWSTSSPVFKIGKKNVAYFTGVGFTIKSSFICEREWEINCENIRTDFHTSMANIFVTYNLLLPQALKEKEHDTSNCSIASMVAVTFKYNVLFN